MPVPCVLATRLGCTQRISSVGENPADRNASTVATRFHSATRSIEFAMSGVMPQTCGSNPVGICAPTVRDSFDLTRHADLGAGLADDGPVGAVGHRADDRVLRVELDERPRVGLGRHHEGEVLVQEHRHQQRRRVIRIDRTRHRRTRGCPRARRPHRGSARPGRPLRRGRRTRCRTNPACGSSSHLIRPGGPGQLENTGCRQFVVDLHLEAGARRAVRPSSAPPTMTTRSAGSTSRSSHSGGGAGVAGRGGDGSAAIV